MRFVVTSAKSASSVAIRTRLTLRRWARGEAVVERWSHAASILDPVSREVVDSTFMLGGVARRTLLDVLAPASLCEFVDCPLPDEDAGRHFLLEQVGKDYDWRSGWGFAIGNAAWYDPADWFCFELVAAQMWAGGLRPDFLANLERVTALDLLRAAKIARELRTTSQEAL